MIILSNCLTDKVDEGALKVANSLTKRLKKRYPDSNIITYERVSDLSDIHLKLNKFFLNPLLFFHLLCERERIIYIPFPTRMLPMSWRVWILSRFTKQLQVFLVMQPKENFLARKLLCLSNAQIYVFSSQSYRFYKEIVGERVKYIKTGVDIDKFAPVTSEQKLTLRKKYGISPETKLILHVGHLNEGRNIRKLMEISNDLQILLVVSTLTKNEEDIELRKELEAKPNIQIIDHYLPHVEEIYQISDVYFFPVEQAGHCIDVPLSVLEAAACNIPVVTTPYGELRELIGREGFWFTDTLEKPILNHLINEALHASVDVRHSVIEYDWNFTISQLLK